MVILMFLAAINNKYVKNLALPKKEGWPLVGNLRFWEAVYPDRGIFASLGSQIMLDSLTRWFRVGKDHTRQY